MPAGMGVMFFLSLFTTEIRTGLQNITFASFIVQAKLWGCDEK